MYDAVGPLAHTEPGGTVEAPAGYGWYRGQKLANGAQRAISGFIDYYPPVADDHPESGHHHLPRPDCLQQHLHGFQGRAVAGQADHGSDDGQPQMYHPGPAGQLSGIFDAFATTLDVDEHLSWIEEMVEALVDGDEPTAVMWLRTFARMPRTEQWPIAWMIRASMPTVGYQPEAES